MLAPSFLAMLAPPALPVAHHSRSEAKRRERDLDRRVDAIGAREAERGLWKLLDASVADGSAVEEPPLR
jgi:hypothetical protein